MLNPTNPAGRPVLADFSAYIRVSLFDDLCRIMTETCGAKPVMDFSRCSLEPGWNLKFKKSGKSLCTVYPREGFFTVMVVVARKEKPQVEAFLPRLTDTVRQIYRSTKEGNGQRWLMIDIEDDASVYGDVLRLIQIRSQTK